MLNLVLLVVFPLLFITPKSVLAQDVFADTATAEYKARMKAFAGSADSDAGSGEDSVTIWPELQNREEIGRLLEAMYPANPRDAGIESDVLMWLIVDEAGRVAKATPGIPSPYPQFNSAASEIVSRARFTPGQSTGGPVSVFVALPIRFRLADAEPALAAEDMAVDPEKTVMAEPWLVVSDGSNNTIAGVMTDTIDANRMDDTEAMYAHSRINIRRGPGTEYRILRTLSRGDSARVGIPYADGWARYYRIVGTKSDGSVHFGHVGWIYKRSDAIRDSRPVIIPSYRRYGACASTMHKIHKEMGRGPDDVTRAGSSLGFTAVMWEYEDRMFTFTWGRAIRGCSFDYVIY